ncbi:zinc finger BED domain-containing protein RICESLEEPER 2-like protein, partial [Tanacetum coccineum]
YERAFARYDSEERHFRDDLEETDLTLKVSRTLYVTSNSFLDDITSIDAALNNCINGVLDKNLAAMAKMMKCKFDKYYGSLEKWDVYRKIKGKAMCAMIKASLVELYEDYVRIHALPERHTMFESVDASSSMNKCSATPVSVILNKRYLNEDVEDESDNFDILNWLKVNSPRFPVLSFLARDVLAIPISMVASEYVFSIGGRVLDAFKSSLTPPIVESLICT